MSETDFDTLAAVHELEMTGVERGRAEGIIKGVLIVNALRKQEKAEKKKRRYERRMSALLFYVGYPVLGACSALAWGFAFYVFIGLLN